MSSELDLTKAAQHFGSLKGQVVIITGGANGIGRNVALKYASHGAKVVIGDLDLKALDAVKHEINSAGGRCLTARCDVTKWEDQCNLFDLAYKNYGAVDVVLPNAGVTELALFEVGEGKDGKLTPPNLKTLDVNLYGVLHTSALALHYFSKPSKSDDPTHKALPDYKSLKALVVTGSMSSFMAARAAPVYTASKAGTLGWINGLKEIADEKGVRLALVCPFFVQTNLLPKDFKVDPRVGFANIDHVATAFLAASTDPNHATSGSAYTIPDSKGIWVIAPNELKPKGLSGLGPARRKTASKL